MTLTMSKLGLISGVDATLCLYPANDSGKRGVPAYCIFRDPLLADSSACHRMVSALGNATNR
jgi:hypothetical protein